MQQYSTLLSLAYNSAEHLCTKFKPWFLNSCTCIVVGHQIHYTISDLEFAFSNIHVSIIFLYPYNVLKKIINVASIFYEWCNVRVSRTVMCTNNIKYCGIIHLMQFKKYITSLLQTLPCTTTHHSICFFLHNVKTSLLLTLQPPIFTGIIESRATPRLAPNSQRTTANYTFQPAQVIINLTLIITHRKLYEYEINVWHMIYTIIIILKREDLVGGRYLSRSPFWGARAGCVCLLMVAKKKKEGVADPGPTSLFLFTPSSPVRRLTTWLISTPLFEGTIIVTIIVNCLSMALDHKLPNDDRTTLSNQLVGHIFYLRLYYNDSRVS